MHIRVFFIRPYHLLLTTTTTRYKLLHPGMKAMPDSVHFSIVINAATTSTLKRLLLQYYIILTYCETNTKTFAYE